MWEWIAVLHIYIYKRVVRQVGARLDVCVMTYGVQCSMHEACRCEHAGEFLAGARTKTVMKANLNS